MFKKTVILVILLALVGCGRISIHEYKAHNDDNLNEGDVSILHVTRHNYVQEIDGKGKYSPGHVSDFFPYSAAKIELLPGAHVLSLKYNNSTHQSRLYTKESKDFSFNFLPGKRYFLYNVIKYARSQTGLQQSISFHIGECGTKGELDYNDRESKLDYWLDPYVPACGI